MSGDPADRPSVVCISGGTSGIGAALVAGFLEDGARVYTFGRDAEKVARLAARFEAQAASGTLITLVGDVTDAEFRQRLVADIAEGPGRLDVLVNNAGVIRGYGDLEESLDDWRATLETNLVAPFAMIQAFADLLERSTSPVVINISSACAQHAFKTCTSTSYSVSKAGLDMLTKRLALGLGPRGIRVNAVAPGVVPSEMWGDASHLIERIVAERHALLQRVVTPEDVAAAVRFLASPAAQVITGTVLNVDAGYTLG